MARIGLRIRMVNDDGIGNGEGVDHLHDMMFDYELVRGLPRRRELHPAALRSERHQSNAGCYRSAAYDRLYDRRPRCPTGPSGTRVPEMTRQMEVDAAMVLQAWQNRIVLVQPWVQGHKAIRSSTRSFPTST